MLYGNKPKNKSENGFTLVETLVYLFLIGLTISSFINFNLAISAARNKNTAISEVQSNALTALNFISAKLRSAKAITLPLAGESGSTTVFRVSDSVVDLRLNTEDGVLYYSEGAGNNEAITSSKVKITNLTFDNLTYGNEPGNIRIVLGLEYNNPSNSMEFTYSQDYQTDINLRRK
jgi:type II secretory pathway pseudopilin PulG